MADESNQLRVRLVTPERILVECLADAVELPAKSGYMQTELASASRQTRVAAPAS